MKRRISISRALLVVLVIILIGICVCVAESYIEQARAEKLLRLVSDVKLGITTRDEVEKATKDFSRYNAVILFADQPKSDRYDVFVFRNLGIAALRFAPMIVISIQINYERNLVVEKSIHLAEEPNRGAMLDERIAPVDSVSSGEGRSTAGRYVLERGSPNDATYILSISDDLSVPDVRRRLDWSIDLSCMTKLGGCGSFREVFKGAFE